MEIEIDNTNVDNNLPWVEKYRPKKIDEVSHQDEVTATLRTSIEKGSLPHLLFYGPPGTGKTSTILALCHELYGPEMKNRVMELNASDERGINVIREKVKTFAQIIAKKTVPGYPCPPFKIIIMDEADSMTPDAQGALRRIMELYSNVTRFCLICNYVSRIIPPLASRCIKFGYKPLPLVSIRDRLLYICDQEGVKTNEDCLDYIISLSHGDMRHAIHTLQNASVLFDKDINKEQVETISMSFPQQDLNSFWSSIQSNNFQLLQQRVEENLLKGYPISIILTSLYNLIITKTDLSDHSKASMCLVLAESEKNIMDGSDSEIQLLNIGSQLMTILHNSK
ncbi:hypothetical protein WA158_001167 [Blastocystis sp. Blastoise]